MRTGGERRRRGRAREHRRLDHLYACTRAPRPSECENRYRTRTSITPVLCVLVRVRSSTCSGGGGGVGARRRSGTDRRPVTSSSNQPSSVCTLATAAVRTGTAAHERTHNSMHRDKFTRTVFSTEAYMVLEALDTLLASPLGPLWMEMSP